MPGQGGLGSISPSYQLLHLRRIPRGPSGLAGSFGDRLGWPLQPFEKYEYVGSPIKAIRENIKYPRGLPSLLDTKPP